MFFLTRCHNVACIFFPARRAMVHASACMPPGTAKNAPGWRRHKTQNIDMKNCHVDGIVNILAFFNVVASRQISPLNTANIRPSLHISKFFHL